LKSIENQGSTSDFSGIFQIAVSAIVILSIFFVSPKLSSTSFVFTHFENRTGFDPHSSLSNTFVCLLGMLTSLYAFAGYEGAATLAEETNNPNEAVPRGVIYTCLVSFVVGLTTVLAILYGC
jgi:amino acid transporter